MRLGFDITLCGKRGQAAPFTPASISGLTRWFRASYTGGTWVGQNGLPDATEDSADVTVGAAVNGLTPASFAGPVGTQFFRTGDGNVVYGASTGSMVVLAKPNTAPVNNATTVSIVGGLVSVQGSGVFQSAFSTTGWRYSLYDGGYKEGTVAATVGNWHCFAARYTGAAVQGSVDGTAFASASTAAGSATLIGTADVLIGCSQAAINAEFDGDILEVLLFNVAITDADLTNIRAYFLARYGLAV